MHRTCYDLPFIAPIERGALRGCIYRVTIHFVLRICKQNFLFRLLVHSFHLSSGHFIYICNVYKLFLFFFFLLLVGDIVG